MEEEKINEAEIRAEDGGDIVEMSQEQKTKKKKRDFYVEAALFLILGILMGVAIKTEAIKKVTIGYDDYRMKIYPQDFNLNQIQADLNKKAEEAQAQAQAQKNPSQNSSVQPVAQPTQSDSSQNNN